MLETATERRLWTDAIDVKPVDYSWDAASLGGDYGDNDGPNGWEIVDPDVSDWTPAQCYRWLRDQNYADPTAELANDLRDIDRGDTDAIIEKWREAVRDGIANGDGDRWVPMMNYYYPLPELRLSPASAQAALEQINTACVVVLVDGEPVLGLAGGGMDFSWDICRAYIALGYYPPVHFAGRLPRMGERDVETARLALEACTIAEGWAVRRVADAQSILDHTRELAAS